MNHLSGLQLDSTIDDYLTEEERIALKEFTEAYEATCPDAPSKHSPQFAHSETGGWRKLDQVTLYRFLSADRLGSTGKFQQEKSLRRLQRSLQYRTECKADVVLDWYLDRLEHPGEPHGRGESLGNSHRTLRRKFSSSSMCSSLSIATGSFRIGEDEEVDILEDLEIAPHHQIQYPGFSAADLEKYRRLRIREFTGRCHKGQPVMFERMGGFLGSGNHAHYTQEQWKQFYIWDLERHLIAMREAAKINKKPIHKFVFCGDGQGMVAAIMNRSIWKAVPLLHALMSLEAYYPEIADTIILFNMPKIATFVYKFVHNLLDPVTANKISLYSTADYEEVFSKIMPMDAVPKEYGGTSKDAYPETATS